MSIYLMTRVFYTPIEALTIYVKRAGKDTPRRVSKTALKITLLALADHANDEGEGSYPSLSTLELKTGLGRATVIHCLKAMQSAGYLLYVGVSKKGTSNYSLLLEYLADVPARGSARSIPAPKKPSMPGNGKGYAQHTSSSMPSTPESSYNHPETPSGVVAPAYLAGVGVLSQKENESQEDYAKRLEKASSLEKLAQAQQGQIDLTWLLPPQQALAREFCRVSGCVPIKRDRDNWRKEIGAWVEMGFTCKTVRDAYAKMKAGDLTCSGPQSLTNTARSFVNASRAQGANDDANALRKIQRLPDGRLMVGNKIYASSEAFRAQGGN